MNVNLTPELRSWLACAIDSEGTIYSHSKSSQPIIVIYNTHKGFVETFARLTQSSISLKKYGGYTRQARAKPLYEARLSKQEHVYALLKILLPWFVIKKQKAINALKWFSMRTRKCQI